MIKAVKLYLKEETIIEVLFNDGVTKRYDVLSLSDKFPQLLALKDRKLFLKGHLLGWGGVVWNDELDIESETIYEDGVTVPNNPNSQTVLIGFEIKECRKSKNITQEQLSKLTGVSQADISRIEKGQLNPSISLLERIAVALNKKLNIKLI